MSPDMEDQLELRALADLRALVCDAYGEYLDSDLVRGAIDLWGADPYRWPEPVSLELQSLGYVTMCDAEQHLVLVGESCDRCAEAETLRPPAMPCGVRPCNERGAA